MEGGGGGGTVEQTPSSAPQVNYLPHQPVIWRMQTNKNIFTLLNHDYNVSIHTVSIRQHSARPMHIKYSSMGFWTGSALIGPRLTKICNLYSKWWLQSRIPLFIPIVCLFFVQMECRPQKARYTSDTRKFQQCWEVSYWIQVPTIVQHIPEFSMGILLWQIISCFRSKLLRWSHQVKVLTQSPQSWRFNKKARKVNRPSSRV